MAQKQQGPLSFVGSFTDYPIPYKYTDKIDGTEYKS